jgi:DNA polymerase III alpha subunit (gram-positive type)
MGGRDGSGWSGENEYREIVQIGALKIDSATLSVIEECNILVKPKINPKLSEFFQTLTNIHQEHVDNNGVTFAQAYVAFSEFCGHALVFSYGNDMFVLGENVVLNHSPAHGSFKRTGMGFINIGPYIHRVDPDSMPYSSGQLWKYFNLPKPHEADEHDALFDCYSILAAMRHLIAPGEKLPV